MKTLVAFWSLGNLVVLFVGFMVGFALFFGCASSCPPDKLIYLFFLPALISMILLARYLHRAGVAWWKNGLIVFGPFILLARIDVMLWLLPILALVLIGLLGFITVRAFTQRSKRS